MRTKRVCIATNFTVADPAFSLNRVVQDQIKMLNMGGFRPVVIVGETFKPIEEYKNAEIRKIPLVSCSNSLDGKDATLDEDVKRLKKAFEENLKDIDVVITHDFIYQPAAVKHNLACRLLAEERPKLRWLHWIHSATPPFILVDLRPFFKEEYLRLLKVPFPNSFYVVFNDLAVAPTAHNFNISERKVKVVPHPIDVCRFFGFDKQLTKLVEENDVLSSDVICAYPVRLDRGKQVEYVIKTMAALKKMGQKISLFIIDFHSTGGDKVIYRQELEELASRLGLTDQEVIWTSKVNTQWQLGVPWETVAKIQLICNLYIHPSVSESYSLTTQEAGLAGAVLVLNGDFPPMREIYGSKAIYRRYSSQWNILADDYLACDGKAATTTKYGPSDTISRAAWEEAYHLETAGKIISHLKNDYASATQAKIRKTRNLRAVLDNYLAPLIYDSD